MDSKKRTIAILLTAALVLPLMLTACGNGGDTPTGDNSTPGVTDTETPDNTPATTSGNDINTSDNEDIATPEPTPDYEPISVINPNTAGNVGGNVNMGEATIQDAWIFYRNPSDAGIKDGGKLYAMKTDGSGKRKICDDDVWDINVIGEWVYYISANDKC